MTFSFGPRIHMAMGCFALVMATMMSGCSSNDTAAIAALEAINDAAVAAGGSKSVRMQKNGEKVGTIYILGDLENVMPHVGELKNVEEIYFQDDSFEDKHVQYVCNSSSLNSLIVSGTKITDEGVKQLAGTRLQALFLDGTAITSAALQSVARISTLVSLDLTATNVADDLTALSELENLEWLVLRDMDLSQLSEPSLTTLLELPNLKRLTVTNTGITKEAIQALKRAKPSLNLEAEVTEDPTAAISEAAESQIQQ